MIISFCAVTIVLLSYISVCLHTFISYFWLDLWCCNFELLIYLRYQSHLFMNIYFWFGIILQLFLFCLLLEIFLKPSIEHFYCFHYSCDIEKEMPVFAEKYSNSILLKIILYCISMFIWQGSFYHWSTLRNKKVIFYRLVSMQFYFNYYV